MALRVGLRDERQMFARTLARELEREAVNALDTRAREDRCLRGQLLGQSAVDAPAAAGILAFGVFADDHPVDLLAVPQRTGHTRKHARGSHVRILIETLADRQPQTPQRNMVRHVRRTYSPEENRIERLEFLEAPLGYVMPVLPVIRAAPREVFDLDPVTAIMRGEPLEHLHTGSDDFDADAVSRDRRDFVRAHVDPAVRKRASYPKGSGFAISCRSVVLQLG